MLKILEKSGIRNHLESRILIWIRKKSFRIYNNANWYLVPYWFKTIPKTIPHTAIADRLSKWNCIKIIWLCIRSGHSTGWGLGFSKLSTEIYLHWVSPRWLLLSYFGLLVLALPIIITIYWPMILMCPCIIDFIGGNGLQGWVGGRGPWTLLALPGGPPPPHSPK